MSGNVRLAMSHVVPDLVQKVLKGQDPLHILGDGRQVRHYTYGGDLARGIRLAIESPAAVNEDFNLSTAQSTTVLELAELIWRKVTGDEPLRYVSDKPYTYDVQKRDPGGREGTPGARLRGDDVAVGGAGRDHPVDPRADRDRGHLMPAPRGSSKGSLDRLYAHRFPEPERAAKAAYSGGRFATRSSRATYRPTRPCSMSAPATAISSTTSVRRRRIAIDLNPETVHAAAAGGRGSLAAAGAARRGRGGRDRSTWRLPATSSSTCGAPMCCWKCWVPSTAALRPGGRLLILAAQRAARRRRRSGTLSTTGCR